MNRHQVTTLAIVIALTIGFTLVPLVGRSGRLVTHANYTIWHARVSLSVVAFGCGLVYDNISHTYMASFTLNKTYGLSFVCKL